jgi:class 3 adenylate cyclase
LSFIGSGALAGIAFQAARGDDALGLGAAIGATIAIGSTAIDTVVHRTPLGDRVRRLPLLASSLAIAAAHLAVILPTLAVANRFETDAWRFGRDAIVYSVVVTLFFIATSRIGRLIGWRVLGNVLVGRYRRPVAESRVFLFLDLADSTGLAERLGEIGVQALIARFYFDIAQPIARHGGEIYQYRGDEISVTWPLDAGIRNATCVACALAIQARIAARAAGYQRDFGAVPTFRIGLHAGPVVVGEVGDERREIMFFGDTINSAARIQSLCKELGQALCISGDLLERLSLPATVRATTLGRFQLRGRQQATEVFGLASIARP